MMGTGLRLVAALVLSLGWLAVPVAAQRTDGSTQLGTGFPGNFPAAGASSADLVAQGKYDLILETAHLGMLNSPDTAAATLMFLSRLGD